MEQIEPNRSWDFKLFFAYICCIRIFNDLRVIIKKLTYLQVCGYFEYKARYTNSAMEIPEFPIAPEVALELLMAANFLDC